jgi:hypothetical protein
MTSVTRQLLDRARVALNDLQHQRADSIARDVLGLGTQIPRATRVEALQLIAASNFPELQSGRNVAQARSALASLLRIDLDIVMPPDLAWRGLDSLFNEVSRETYSISVLVRRENPIFGVDGEAPLRVRANRLSSFTLIARSKDGIESILLDSVTVASDTILMLRVGRDGRLLLKAAPYDFVVRATDPTSRESITRVFDGVAVVPAVSYVAAPARVDSSTLLPERTRPKRTATIVGGILGAVGTIALGKGLRGKAPLANKAEYDSRYTIAAFGIVAASVAASFFDKGRILDKNVARNRQLLEEASGVARSVIAENARRVSEYRASISINPEAR